MKKPVGINSYDKDKFVIGKTYWTFYTFASKNYKGFSEYVKVFETNVIGEKSYSKPNNKSFEFDLSKIKLSQTMTNNLPLYMNGYGLSYCNFYETEEDAKLAHDLHIIEFCKENRLNGEQKERLYYRMYDKSLIPVTKIEKESIEWYKSLDKKQQIYILWLKDNYTKF